MMGKSLSEMTLEELWQLFPIRLTEHQSIWREWFVQERDALLAALNGIAVRISHIGSTAVEGIRAKPIVDILLETAVDDFPAAEQAAFACGFRVMSRSGVRVSFNKGYTEDGFAERVFHLHLRVKGDCDELYFREYLRLYPEAAQEYEALKMSLWRRFEHDRDAYTAGKTEFVTRMTAEAKTQMTLLDRHMFRPLALAEVPVMFGMFLSRVQWMNENGIRHWNVTKYHEAYPLEYCLQEWPAGTMHALTDICTGELLAAGSLLDEDGFWPEDGVPAVYLHRFVSRIGAGGAGAVFLAQAGRWARARGAEYLRLDSADDNPRLAYYYEEKGFLPVGICTDGPYTGILRQKKL